MGTTIFIKDQKTVPFAPISVAQVNEALEKYSSDQTITAGLTALKAAIIAGIENASVCLQCGGKDATGKITVNKVVCVCPLCNGNTVTEGLYMADRGPVISFTKV